MVERRHVGSASIGVGALLFTLGAICIALTALGFLETPSGGWVFPWITNYLLGGIGVVVGILFAGYGLYTRRLLRSYVEKVEELTETKEEQARELRGKEIELGKTEAELEQKETSLMFTKGKLRSSRKLARKRSKQMYSVRGKLGDRSKRLKQIGKIAKVKKKKKKK